MLIRRPIPIQIIQNEEMIGENMDIFGEKEYILSFINQVILAINERQRNIPTQRLKRSGGARDIFPIASNIRNILQPNAHGVNPVMIAMNI